jgi:hypothetical protein
MHQKSRRTDFLKLEKKKKNPTKGNKMETYFLITEN